MTDVTPCADAGGSLEVNSSDDITLEDIMSFIRGHVQTIVGKINVIMTLTVINGDRGRFASLAQVLEQR